MNSIFQRASIKSHTDGFVELGAGGILVVTEGGSPAVGRFAGGEFVQLPGHA